MVKMAMERWEFGEPGGTRYFYFDVLLGGEGEWEDGILRE